MDKLRAFVGKLVYALARTFHDFFGLRASCRFAPTCSQYAREAITRHGIVRGGAMAIRRVLRCRPGGSWGPDPVSAS